MADSKTHLVWNPDNIRDVAESVGISLLNEEATRTLAKEVEYRISQVIVEAMRFMHQGKRTVLGTQDISQALKVLDCEPLYGYESTRPLRFGEASLGPGQPLFYIEDEEIDFEKLINAPLPKVPRDISFTAHWLAVEGVQPSIPQNPTTAEARASELVPKGPGANPSLGALAGNDNVTFKPQVKHVVSKELILFFDKIRGAILDPDDEDPDVVALRKSALTSVRNETGLHQLVPYFVQFVAEKVTHSINDMFVLRQMMELTDAVIGNKSLFIDPYITALAPPILTCLVGRHLGREGDNPKDQYQLRDLAASLTGIISQKYGNTSHELRPRLARTCLKNFLDPTRSLGEHYGALSGFSIISGADGICKILLPTIKPYETVIQKAIAERGERDLDVQMIQAAIFKSITSLVDGEEIHANGTNGMMDDGSADQLVEFLGPLIGEKVAGLGNRRLNKIILDSREKTQ